MNILFYTQFDSRSRDTESLMLAFMNQENKVYFLSMTESQEYVNFLNKTGVKASFNAVKKSNKFLNHLFHLLFLIRYCHKNKIDVVYSHLEYANFIAVLSQYFMKSKVVICRHHVDEIHLNGQEKSISYYLIYKLAKNIIVVSQRAKEFMVKTEKVNPDKIYKINLAYNFDLYDKVSYDNVSLIRKQYSSELLIVSACRLVKDKRPELGIELIEKLSGENIHAKLMILGKGEMSVFLQEEINRRNLKDKVFLLGHQKNILDYLAAADVVFHPSVLDSSSVIVKESGLVKKPVIVCSGVGDFDDYVKSGENGVLVSKEDTVTGAVEFLKAFNLEKKNYTYLGENLFIDVMRLFSVEKILTEYNRFNS
ncbi:MAG: glycosyltransferase [Sporocytophaga sp.]|nr:glycosyltransferase [Sporocytophaga sp.]